MTTHRPKALVEVAGKPLLAWTLQRIQSYGIREVVVNVHHFADQIEAFLEENSPAGMKIAVSDERQLLLNTGGGLRKASPFLQKAEHILLWNVDVIAPIDFEAFAKCHQTQNGLATLAVSRRNSSRYLLFTQEKRLGGWENKQSGERKICLKERPLQALAFSGVHLIKRDLLNLLPKKSVFSIIEAYLRLCRQHPIYAWEHPAKQWVDAGRPEDLPRAEKLIQSSYKTSR